MTTFVLKLPSSTNAKVHCLKASALFLSVFLLTACQETPEPEAPTETPTQTTPVTTNINVNEAADDSIENAQNPSQTEANSERDVSLTELEQDLGGTVAAPSNTATSPNPEQAIKGAQITDCLLYTSDAADE